MGLTSVNKKCTEVSSYGGGGEQVLCGQEGEKESASAGQNRPAWRAAAAQLKVVAPSARAVASCRRSLCASRRRNSNTIYYADE